MNYFGKVVEKLWINYGHNIVYLLAEEFPENVLLVDYVYNYKSELYRNAENKETKLGVLCGPIRLDAIVAQQMRIFVQFIRKITVNRSI